VHRLAASNMVEMEYIEQQESWVLWVTVKCWLYLLE